MSRAPGVTSRWEATMPGNGSLGPASLEARPPGRRRTVVTVPPPRHHCRRYRRSTYITTALKTLQIKHNEWGGLGGWQRMAVNSGRKARPALHAVRWPPPIRQAVRSLSPRRNYVSGGPSAGGRNSPPRRPAVGPEQAARSCVAPGPAVK